MLQHGLKLPLRPLHGFASQLLSRGGVRDGYFQGDEPQYNVFTLSLYYFFCFFICRYNIICSIAFLY
jgi:hypothetical protein